MQYGMQVLNYYILSQCTMFRKFINENSQLVSILICDFYFPVNIDNILLSVDKRSGNKNRYK